MEISHLEQARDRELRCDNCGSTVAWDKDVFALPGAEGVVGAYVNPHGYVHQVGVDVDDRQTVPKKRR